MKLYIKKLLLAQGLMMSSDISINQEVKEENTCRMRMAPCVTTRVSRLSALIRRRYMTQGSPSHCIWALHTVVIFVPTKVTGIYPSSCMVIVTSRKLN